MKNEPENTKQQLQENIEEITHHLELLFIEQKKLQKELKKEFNSDKTVKDGYPQRTEFARAPRKNKKKKQNGNKKRELNIGDIVEVTTNHKNRNRIVARIVGFRGKTQYIVKSSIEAEEEAESHLEEFAVWKQNVKELLDYDDEF